METKRNCDVLEGRLKASGFPATSIHSNRSQQEREMALADFKAKRTPILVATNVAARGLDIDNVAHVINYDMPKDIDDYIHRIGRTGRAGHTGTATSFVSEYNARVCKELVMILLDGGQECPQWLKSLAAKHSGGVIGRKQAEREEHRELERKKMELESGIPSETEANKMEIQQKKMETMFGAPSVDEDAGSMW